MIYVDDYRLQKRVGTLTARWSHLLADTSPELEAFARQLGLRPDWLQYPGTPREHYDVTDNVRARAIRLGARPITYRQSGELVARKRAAAKPADPEPAPVVPPPLPDPPPDRPAPRWNPTTRRHAWLRVRDHWYRCQHCDLTRENEHTAAGWVAWWHWPDGSVTADVAVPKCPGPAE